MEMRDLNPEAVKPEVAATPATQAESLESQSIADEGMNLSVAEAAAQDKAQFNLEAQEAQLADKAFNAEQTVEAVESEEADAPIEAESTGTATGDADIEVVSEEADTPADAKNDDDLKTKDDVMARLTRLAVDEAVEISRDEIAHLKQRFYAIRKLEQEAELAAHLAEGKDAESFMPALDPAEEEFKNMMNTVRERKAAQAAAEEEARTNNLNRKLALIEELKTISADTDNVNRTFPRVKEIQAEFKEIGEVPPTEATDLWKNYQVAVEQFYDQLKVNKDLRDYDFRKNLELKTLLCEEAEKLNDEEDIVLAFKRLQNLHDEWRQTGPVAKEVREEIWTRFKDASTQVNKKYQLFFEERKARELENEKAKTEICERVEALDFSGLKTYAAWDEMTKQILAAQEEWKKLGFASRKANNALFARFRSVCDKFFTLKAEHYREMKDELANNLARKTALCEKAEALKDSTDWKKTAEELVRLQKEWKTIGTVPKKHSDNIWHRFQAACDAFFESRKANLSESRAAEQVNLKAKREVIAALKEIPLDANRGEMMPKVKELQAKWQSIGHVPMREKDKLYDEYRAACDNLYNNLGRDRGGRSRFEDVINEMGSDEQKLYRERERILRAFEIKRNELKTYENNLGFLSSKSKSGDSMVREMERRIQRIKDDLASIEEKIKLIDSKLR
ncbi:MAG: DUF349 domain-containing protein [Muribaculaceae bacterium]|nr:DUF349 domain-containing protein [Muribaculaceae bacterium]